MRPKRLKLAKPQGTAGKDAKTAASAEVQAVR